jgi:hypothetical protein
MKRQKWVTKDWDKQKPDDIKEMVREQSKDSHVPESPKVIVDECKQV